MTSIEDTAISGAAGGVVKALAGAVTKPKTAREMQERLDVLEAERMVLTIEVRNELLREMKALLPEAIRQAKGKVVTVIRNGKKHKERRPGSSGLLRLISRTAMRNVTIEKRN